MTTVTTIKELQNALSEDGQESGTMQGWIIFEGQKMFVRKHWSYQGGFPVYSDETINTLIGLLKRDGEAFKYELHGVPQYRHGVKSWPEYDFKLTLVNEN